MRLWESLLRTTSGAIETSDTKTDWVHIGFEWKQGKCFMKEKDTTLQMMIRNHRGNEVAIKQLGPHEARETLGVMQSPDGSEKAQVKKLEKKIGTCKNNVWNSSIKRTAARIAVESTIGKTLDYPLLATAMSKEQCSNISTQFESVALPKSGVVRTPNKNLVRAPESIGGYEIKDLYTKQFISYIQALIDHGTSTSIKGQLICILEEGVLLEAGMEGDLFSIKPSICTWLEHNWITNTLKMMEDFDISLKQDKWKDDDTFLMQEISKGSYTPQELQKINQVRQYLQVVSLADITVSDGTKL